MTDWAKLRGHSVSVYAGGVLYRGTVVELGPHSLLLRAAGGFREIPWEKITRVLEEEAQPRMAPSALKKG